MELPLIAVPATSATATAQTPSQSAGEGAEAGAGRSIVVVDDNRDVADGLATLLEFWGFRCQVFYDGSALLEALPNLSVDVLLMDIGLPGIDGFELARRVRARHPDPSLQLIAVTGYGGGEDRALSAEAGFDHHLTKPIDIAGLRDLLGVPS